MRLRVVMTEVVLVDKMGNELGLMEKLKAHHNPGFLHRAVSVVLYKKTDKGVEILLQKRAASKPLWPLYWANTVCTHPLPGEGNLDCAVRRLKEEMSIEIEKEKLQESYTFYYQADYSDKLSEHELDAVVVGRFTGNYILNPEEVADAKWMEWSVLKNDLMEKPEIYAPWPKMIFTDSRLLAALGVNE